MSVRNLECQIAKAQIGRYVVGEGLLPNALTQLEAHIASCPECAAAVEERRDALRAMLAHTTVAPCDADPAPRPAESKASEKVVVELQHALEGGASSPTGWLEALRAEAGSLPANPAPTKQQSPATRPASNMKWKPIALSGLLAAVLIGMSHFFKGPTSVLGSRVVEVLPDKPEPTPLPPTEPRNPFEQPKVAQVAAAETAQDAHARVETPTATQEARQVAAGPKVSKTNPPIAGQLAAAPSPKLTPVQPKPLQQRPKPKPSDNTVRVYDEHGNPIG